MPRLFLFLGLFVCLFASNNLEARSKKHYRGRISKTMRKAPKKAPSESSKKKTPPTKVTPPSSEKVKTPPKKETTPPPIEPKTEYDYALFEPFGFTEDEAAFYFHDFTSSEMNQIIEKTSQAIDTTYRGKAKSTNYYTTLGGIKSLEQNELKYLAKRDNLAWVSPASTQKYASAIHLQKKSAVKHEKVTTFIETALIRSGLESGFSIAHLMDPSVNLNEQLNQLKMIVEQGYNTNLVYFCGTGTYDSDRYRAPYIKRFPPLNAMGINVLLYLREGDQNSHAATFYNHKWKIHNYNNWYKAKLLHRHNTEKVADYALF